MEYFFTALIPVLAVICIVIVAKRIASHAFRCKHCSHKFHIPWQKVLFSIHSGDDYMLVCPHCNTKDWCVKTPITRH